MKHRKTLGIASVFLVLSLLMVSFGCSKSATTTSTTTTAATQTKASSSATSATQAKETLKIGSIMAMSGPAAAWGIEFSAGMQAYVNYVNKNGGLRVGDKTYTVQYINYDSAFQVEQGVAAAYRLIQEDNVKFILVMGINVVIAVQPIAERAKVISVMSKATPTFYKQPNNYSYCDIVPYEWYASNWISWMQKNMPQAKRVALLTPDDDGGQGKHLPNVDQYPKAGMEIAYDGYFPPTTKDFYPYIAKVLAAKPDIVDVSSPQPAIFGLLAKQFREQGYTGPIVWFGKVTGQSEADVATWAALENTYAVAEPTIATGFKSPLMEALAPEGRITLKYEPTSLYYVWADGVAAILAGIQAAGSVDTDKVTAAMSADSFTWKGPWGTGKLTGKNYVGLGQNRMMERVLEIYKVENGKVVVK